MVKEIAPDSIVAVDKPTSCSTFDIIRIFKRATSFPGKIGHGGTLDPFATGVVLLLLDRATARFEEIRSWEKTYLAGLRLGAESSTQDPSGEILSTGTGPSKDIRREAIAEVAACFTGSFEQRVPAYSAAKFQGSPLYQLARKGIQVAKTKTVTVFQLDLVNYRWPLVCIRVRCSGGFYVRQLASDIGERLGCGAFLYFLRRERVGAYALGDCLAIDDLRRLEFTGSAFKPRGDRHPAADAEGF